MNDENDAVKMQAAQAATPTNADNTSPEMHLGSEVFWQNVAEHWQHCQDLGRNGSSYVWREEIDVLQLVLHQTFHLRNLILFQQTCAKVSCQA